MNQVRLLPILIVAASGLFVLKTAELLSSGEALFSQTQPAKKITREEDLPQFARALAKHRFRPTPEEPDVTGSVPPKKDDAKDQKAKDPKAAEPGKTEPVKSEAGKDAPKPEQVAQAQPAAQALPSRSSSPAERALLERLQERRSAIDDRSKEMELRENLLQAAERKLDGRINELKDVETRLDVGAKAERDEADRQMKTIVTMYETMKPKEAARVFDRLNVGILVPIVTAMNPRKMAEVLAVMSPEAAERLTVALAMRSRDGGKMQPQGGGGNAQGELPRIDQPAPRAAQPKR